MTGAAVGHSVAVSGTTGADAGELLKPSSIAVEFGQVKAARRRLTRWGALPATVLFRVEDKMKAGEMLTHCRTAFLF